MRRLARSAPPPDGGLAVLRLVTGTIFAAHGAQKLFVFGISGATHAFAGMGVPMPQIAAPLIAGLELIGGIALILGLLTRVFGLALAAEMLGVIFIVKLGGGLFAPAGFELELALLGGALALALAGAGDFSVDRVVAHRRSR